MADLDDLAERALEASARSGRDAVITVTPAEHHTLVTMSGNDWDKAVIDAGRRIGVSIFGVQPVRVEVQLHVW